MECQYCGNAWFGGRHICAAELDALRARVAELEAASEEAEPLATAKSAAENDEPPSKPLKTKLKTAHQQLAP